MFLFSWLSSPGETQVWGGNPSLNMDKVLHRKDVSLRTDDEEPSRSIARRQWKESNKQLLLKKDYIKYGFSYCGDETSPKPECIICGKQLSDESMATSKLNRSLYSNHAKEDRQYFKRCSG